MPTCLCSGYRLFLLFLFRCGVWCCQRDALLLRADCAVFVVCVSVMRKVSRIVDCCEGPCRLVQGWGIVTVW